VSGQRPALAGLQCGEVTCTAHWIVGWQEPWKGKLRFEHQTFHPMSYTSVHQPMFHGGTLQVVFHISSNFYSLKHLQDKKKRHRCYSIEITAVLPIYGQKIPLVIEGLLGIVCCISKFLCIYSVISHCAPNDVLWNPGCEPLVYMLYSLCYLDSVSHLGKQVTDSRVMSFETFQPQPCGCCSSKTPSQNKNCVQMWQLLQSCHWESTWHFISLKPT
jgi:hypothetical protein